MSEQQGSDRGTFGRMGFILAAAGSAIGLGNIWKFPYIAYANEGGSFVLVYLVAILLVGAPIMLAETLIGRRTQQSPVGAFLRLGVSERVVGGRGWGWLGGLGVFGGFAILSYYAVVAGWVVFYFLHCLQWSFRGFDASADSLVAEFSGFLANPGLQIGFHGLFMAVTILIVLLGVKAGIERTTKFLMPVLVVILVLLVINSMRSPGFGEAIGFLFHIGPIHANGVLEALGHAFFTLSLGMGAMITYGSYVSREESLPRAGGVICLLDTVIALMAAVVMFSIIFSVPLAERAATFGSRSATILFTTLPRMFYELPAGTLIAPVFYLLVAFAALTSTISLLEVVVAYFIDVREWSRKKAALVVGGFIFLAGIPSALSLGAVGKLSTFQLPGLPDSATSFFGTVDYLATNWLLPLGGLGIALYVGWVLPGKLTREELEEGHGRFSLYPVWLFLVRFVCPLAILWILWEVIQGRSFA